MKIKVPLPAMIAIFLLFAYTIALHADARRAPQHPVPEATQADFLAPPRAVFLVFICDDFARIYFTTSDGRAVQVTPAGDVPVAILADSILRAALFDAVRITTDDCATPKKMQPQREGITDL